MVLELQPPERSVLLMLEGSGDLASRVQGLGLGLQVISPLIGVTVP